MLVRSVGFSEVPSSHRARSVHRLFQAVPLFRFAVQIVGDLYL